MVDIGKMIQKQNYSDLLTCDDCKEEGKAVIVFIRGKDGKIYNTDGEEEGFLPDRVLCNDCSENELSVIENHIVYLNEELKKKKELSEKLSVTTKENTLKTLEESIENTEHEIDVWENEIVRLEKKLKEKREEPKLISSLSKELMLKSGKLKSRTFLISQKEKEELAKERENILDEIADLQRIISNLRKKEYVELAKWNAMEQRERKKQETLIKNLEEEQNKLQDKIDHLEARLDKLSGSSISLRDINKRMFNDINSNLEKANRSRLYRGKRKIYRIDSGYSLEMMVGNEKELFCYLKGMNDTFNLLEVKISIGDQPYIKTVQQKIKNITKIKELELFWEEILEDGQSDVNYDIDAIYEKLQEIIREKYNELGGKDFKKFNDRVSKRFQ